MVIAREHRRPDIVYTEKQKSKCQVINIATFSDKIITMKQQQKMAIIRPIVRDSDCRMWRLVSNNKLKMHLEH